ncbi:MAG: A/G-specific adenine glycosylase [Phycisphaerales bacterium]
MLAELATPLERWFRRNARDLPWRRAAVRSGYAALVSEAMLQQTQVPRVIDAFEAFMRRFPSVAALAAADEQEVLAAWRGLGYYRRARNLHAAARMIVERFDGAVPRRAAELRGLPGVGRYTAGAIASIVFDERTAIVDGNVARVLLRLRGERAQPDTPATQRWLWNEAQRLVDHAIDPGVFNEALMELGAVVCTPASPRCLACPLAQSCAALRDGLVDRIPTPKRAAPRRTVVHHAVVARRGERFLVVQRPETGLWSRMWQVPTVEADEMLAPGEIGRRLDVAIGRLVHRGEFVHATTHRRIHVRVYSATSRARRGRWLTIDELESIPMSNAARRAISLALDNQ